MRIDAHHHFWRYTGAEFPWIGGEDMDVLKRDFLPEDLAGPMREAGIGGLVTVQARTSLAETRWLLDLWEQRKQILGVVGWVPLGDPKLESLLESLAAHPGLVGVREVLQDKPAGAMEDPTFHRGLSLLPAAGLVYDLLIVEAQLPGAIPLVDRHPDLVFVLDHFAKPRIGDGVLDPWADRLRELARRPNVVCKLSGLVTEADVRTWTSEALRPYAETALEAFGPHRILAGSDWPVCLCACGYARWFSLIDAWIGALSADEQAAIRGGTARRVYGLKERT